MTDTPPGNSDNMAKVSPVKFGLNDSFQFRCHHGLSCFTECCRSINIILTPYDIVRLKNRLGLSSGDFLSIYTEPRLLEKTDLPVVTLKLLDDERQSCPFVRDDGCIVYQDRPTTCRYYPLGVASLSHREEDQELDQEGFFFFINEPHCRGFEEPVEWTVASWRKDQGVDIHDEINAEWTDLVVRKRSFPPNIRLTEEAKKMFFMASYDIDRFKRFVFESTFLQRYPVDEATRQAIAGNEVELLKFAFRWLKSILFKGAAAPPA
ncbi:MAG: YkgJ family cysteine cluster protein [Thermodesulfobacteriota bacterium]